MGSDIKKVSTGMVDEKVTVISSVVHTYIPRPRWRLRWDQLTHTHSQTIL